MLPVLHRSTPFSTDAVRYRSAKPMGKTQLLRAQLCGTAPFVQNCSFPYVGHCSTTDGQQRWVPTARGRGTDQELTDIIDYCMRYNVVPLPS